MTQTHQVSSTNSVFHCSEPLFMGHSNVPDIQMRLVKVPAPPWPRTQLHLGLSELAGILCMCSSPSYCSPGICTPLGWLSSDQLNMTGKQDANLASWNGAKKPEDWVTKSRRGSWWWRCGKRAELSAGMATRHCRAGQGWPQEHHDHHRGVWTWLWPHTVINVSLSCWHDWVLSFLLISLGCCKVSKRWISAFSHF